MRTTKNVRIFGEKNMRGDVTMAMREFQTQGATRDMKRRAISLLRRKFSFKKILTYGRSTDFAICLGSFCITLIIVFNISFISGVYNNLLPVSQLH